MELNFSEIPPSAEESLQLWQNFSVARKNILRDDGKSANYSMQVAKGGRGRAFFACGTGAKGESILLSSQEARNPKGEDTIIEDTILFGPNTGIKGKPNVTALHLYGSVKLPVLITCLYSRVPPEMVEKIFLGSGSLEDLEGYLMVRYGNPRLDEGLAFRGVIDPFLETTIPKIGAFQYDRKRAEKYANGLEESPGNRAKRWDVSESEGQIQRGDKLIRYVPVSRRQTDTTSATGLFDDILDQ